LKFFEEFGSFLKEGVVTDAQHKEEIAKLLRMESSATTTDQMTSLDEYVSRMTSDQKEIFYLISPNREFAQQSPYFEGFQKRGIEVLFLYSSIDDFVMTNLQEYNGKRLKSIEAADSNPGDAQSAAADEGNSDIKLADNQVKELCDWMKQTLESSVVQVKVTKRLVNSPAIVVDHESAALRRMMRMADPQNAPKLPKQVLEINDSHPIIVKLNVLRNTQPVLAKQVAEQVFDNALIAAGLLDDPRSMLTRLNQLLERAIDKETSA
jgi:TNF receptor-associated protein 1